MGIVCPFKPLDKITIIGGNFLIYNDIESNTIIFTNVLVVAYKSTKEVEIKVRFIDKAKPKDDKEFIMHTFTDSKHLTGGYLSSFPPH